MSASQASSSSSSSSSSLTAFDGQQHQHQHQHQFSLPSVLSSIITMAPAQPAGGGGGGGGGSSSHGSASASASGTSSTAGSRASTPALSAAASGRPRRSKQSGSSEHYPLDTFTASAQEGSPLLFTDAAPSPPGSRLRNAVSSSSTDKHTFGSGSDDGHEVEHSQAVDGSLSYAFDDEDEDDDYELHLGSYDTVSASSARSPASARQRKPGQRGGSGPKGILKHTTSSMASTANTRSKLPNWLARGHSHSSSGIAHGSPLSFAHRLGWLERHRVFNLCLVIALSTTALTLYFSIPSTLYVYLPTVFLAMPLSLAIDVRALVQRRRAALTRTRLLWIIFGLTPLALCTWHPLSLLFFPGWDADSTGSSISAALTGAELTRGPITGQKLPPLPEPIQNRTYYFVANLYNVEAILPAWTSTMLRIIERVGRDNVYLSIYESNSKDATKRMLARFDTQLGSLGIQRLIRMDDESTRVGKEHGERVGDRIEYLSMVRNVALKPLDDGLRGIKPGRDFDRVVWFNDVLMDADEVIDLLATNDGKWDQVCAFDYISLGIYDTWVTRDVYAQRTKPMWPYFQELSDVQRLREGLPIEVNACWNGITAFDAKWYIDSSMEHWPRVKQLRAERAAAVARSTSIEASSRSATVEQAGGASKLEERLGPLLSSPSLSREQPWRGGFDEPPKMPLRFRPSKVCIASECMLFSFDMHRLVRALRLPAPERISPRNTLRPLILMNPKVGVTYDRPAWLLYHHILRWNVVRPWKVVWQDLISHLMFGWVTDWGKKPTACKAPLAYGWVEPPPWKGELSEPVAS